MSHLRTQRNIKLVLEYDGTDFVGWQIQAEGRSVQGELEKVLRQVLQEDVNVMGAGRTDAGVHARGQVANFRTAAPRSIEEIRQALDGLLPEDIVVKSVEEVPIDFHARYSARERRYRYFISTEKSAMDRRYSWFVTYKLDLDAMMQAARLIEGQHDFEAFSKTDSGVDNYVCTVRSSEWMKDGSFLIFDIRADRFVRGMVRALVGTMIDVGRGYRTVEEFKGILLNKSRAEAGVLAPAKGLFLEEVIY